MKSNWIKMAAAAAVMLTAAGAAVAQDFPTKPVRVIVPTDAGGSIDTVARIIQRYVDRSDALGQKIAVVNMPGAGGTIATREIKDSEPDGYTVGIWHEGLITSKVMGVADFDHSDFRILGSTGYTEIGLAVGDDNEIDTFDQLLATAEAEPGSVLVATNVGLAVHFIPLMVEDRAGVQFRYVQVGGGAKRFPSVVAGHTDTAIFGVSEMVKWQEAGLNPIVVFSEERVPELPEVPTAKESGIDMVNNGYRIWLAPKDIPDDVFETLSGLLKGAIEDETTNSEMAEAGYRPVFVSPEETVSILDDWRASAEPLVAKAKELEGQ